MSTTDIRTVMMNDDELESRTREAVRSLTAALPTEYAALAHQLALIRRVVHEEIARTLEPVFNRRVQETPSDSLAAKRAICVWANDELKNLGLAVRCRKTGRPGILIGHPARAGDAEGRFRLELRDEGGRMSRSYFGNRLPDLALMEHSVRREAFATKYRRPPDTEPSR